MRGKIYLLLCSLLCLFGAALGGDPCCFFSIRSVSEVLALFPLGSAHWSPPSGEKPPKSLVQHVAVTKRSVKNYSSFALARVRLEIAWFV